MTKVNMLFMVMIIIGMSSCSKKSNTNDTAEFEGDDKGECSDGADNDRNQLFDCEDPGCASSPACRNNESEQTDENDSNQASDEQDPTDKEDSEDSEDPDSEDKSNTDESYTSDTLTSTETEVDTLENQSDSDSTDLPGDLPNDTDDAGIDTVSLDGGIPSSDADLCINDAIEVTLRDFSVDHPDFQSYSGSAPTTGLLEDTLGPDRKPVFKSSEGNLDGGGTRTQLTSKESFDQWYRDVEGVNYTFSKTLPLEETDEGVMTYASNAFFPIGPDEGWGTDIGGHTDNFLFTTEIHIMFTYREAQVFSFTGDDDLWIFINNKLALDLGGLHSAEFGSIDLDAFAEAEGLESGERYSMDIFHAERHTGQSNFRIDTNIECIKSVIII